MLGNNVDRLEDFGGSSPSGVKQSDPRFYQFVLRFVTTVKEFFSGATDVVDVDADYDVTEDDGFLRIDATAGNITINLLPVADAPTKPVIFKRMDASVNTVTIEGSGVETIDGVANISLNTRYKSRTLYPGAAGAWDIIGAHL